MNFPLSTTPCLSTIARFVYLRSWKSQSVHLSQFCLKQNDAGISLSNKLSTTAAPSSQSIKTRLDSFGQRTQATSPLNPPPQPSSYAACLSVGTLETNKAQVYEKIYINFNMPAKKKTRERKREEKRQGVRRGKTKNEQ